MDSKRCNRCLSDKPAEEFYKNSNGRGVFGRRADCKTCVNKMAVKRVAQWRLDNPGRRNAGDKQYRKENREQCYQASLRSMAKKKDYYNAKARVSNERRRARVAGAEGEFTQAEWEVMVSENGNLCSYCGKRSDALAQEHVVPLYSGGRHEASNIVPACKRCNSIKKTRPFLSALYYIREFSWQ